VEAHFEQTAPRPDRSTILAYDRTGLSYQRTMLSWVRGTSLIAFGFAIYNFHRVLAGDQPSTHLIGPHEFALIMVGIGLVSLLLATLEYRRDIAILVAQFPEIRRSPLPGSVALLIVLLGLLAMFTMIFRQ
jgi:uncharacterized membrane protein YidH (DUF202 family)